ncbi:MAG: asparagine synthase (glutamine-hydrolyzing) [Thermodesulfobacteriota bacterium]|nr:asparagine synthase (glutamine-hydrolyzing) [Thermodesulfobacteriota bacterium]
MCGIAGIVNFSTTEYMEDLLRRMLGLIRHRGPDAFGLFMGTSVGLAHSRLSIIDLNSGDQPIHNEDRSVWIVFNGEIFNYPELREQLKKQGHRFYTQTDTEVLVHLYEDHGTNMFNCLNGQFAFALWDSNKEVLLLGRDRVGIRPLYYYNSKGRLVFGSEVKALFADPTIPRTIDIQTISDIFTCWAPLGHFTVFEDVYQVPPGHYALFSQNGISIHPYWKLNFDNSNNNSMSLSELTEELSHLICDAARIRLRADVPVGAYLSGGLDSTYIAGLVKHKFNNLLFTFSVAFTDERFDESVYQNKAVESLKTDHRIVRCTERQIGEAFPHVVWHTEVPILRTAPAPFYYLSRLVRDNCFKVVLTGEGADEIFAGYNIFKEDRVRRFWARDPNSAIRPRLLETLYPYVFSENNGKANAFLSSFFKKNLSKTDSPAFSHMLRWENTGHLKSFFTNELNEEVGGLNVFIDRFISMLPPEYMSWNPLSRAQYTEAFIFLSNYLLSSQGDRMGMAHSVEGRFPFLDHRVVEFATRVPPRYLLAGLKEKFILKQAASDFVPTDLIERAKQPYRAPINQCFMGNPPLDYVEELLSETAIEKNSYFNSKKVIKLLNKCRHQKNIILSERDNMALVGILSTQLIDHLFIKNFPMHSIHEPEDVKIFP